jgi:ABC-type transport system substrate-binding protein
MLIEMEKVMKKKLFLMLSLLVLVSITIACSPKETTPATTSVTTSPTTKTTTPVVTTPATVTPKKGGILKIASASDATLLGDPMMKTLTDMSWSRPVIEHLARFDTTSKLVPWLALSWVGDANAKTFTVKLRQGVKFHDGTDFNADAVIWNWQRWKDSPSGGLDIVSSFVKVDNYTVQVNLSVWENTTDYKLLQSKGGMVSPTAWKSNPAGWGEKNPTGTGPFKFVSWTRDAGATYTRWDGYWQPGQPYLDGIQFVIITDPATRLAAFKAGEVDLLPAATAQQAPELTAAAASGKYVETLLANGMGATETFVVMDGGNADSIYYNAKVRTAVDYAIDKNALVKNLTSGLATASNQWGLPTNWAYNKTLVGHPYNIAKAKSLLAEAGYPNGLSTSMRIDPYTQAYSQSIQAMLADAGIKCDLVLTQPAGMMELFAKGWNNQMLLVIAGADSDVAERLRGFFVKGLAYWASIALPQDLGDQILAAVRAPDFATKQALTWKNQSYIFDQITDVVPLWVNSTATFKYPYVHNDGFSVVHAEEWTPEAAWMDK